MDGTAPPLVVIVGPTAVGKTALSLELAEAFSGEIVSADSRQFYQGMDIGTAKPGPEDLTRAPHHLIDICQPDQQISLSQFQEMAYQAIGEIHARDRIPFLVGGSALYVRAVVEGLRIPEVPPNPALRAELEATAASEGSQALHTRLQELDPASAEKIHPHNVRRLVRALEIVLTTGQKKSELEGAAPPPYAMLQIGLDLPREELHRRIDQRVEAMVAAGLVEEAAALLRAGYDPQLPALSSLGYPELFAHLQGDLSLEQAIERIQIETHRFVRHQYTWFRRMPDVHWFRAHSEVAKEVRPLVAEFLQQHRANTR